jgi:hypothetical protein
MKFEVTQAHIDNGTPKNSCHCPLALALKCALKKRHKPRAYIQVGLESHVRIKDAKYLHTPETAAFVIAFDGGKPVQPGVYEFLPATDVGRRALQRRVERALEGTP